MTITKYQLECTIIIMQTNVTISCHVTLDITTCMWYPHQNNEHPPSNHSPWSLNVLNTPQVTATLGVSMFWINI